MARATATKTVPKRKTPPKVAGETTTNSRKRYEPVAAGVVVTTLPASASRSVPDEVLDAIVSANGGYVAIDLGGRKPNSAAAVLNGAAKRRGMTVKIKTATRDGQVYAWVKQ